MPVNKTYKDGGSGKGQALRQGLNLDQYGNQLEKTHGTRVSNCMDCFFFKSVKSGDIVDCSVNRRDKVTKFGLDKCTSFVED